MQQSKCKLLGLKGNKFIQEMGLLPEIRNSTFIISIYQVHRSNLHILLSVVVVRDINGARCSQDVIGNLVIVFLRLDQDCISCIGQCSWDTFNTCM